MLNIYYIYIFYFVFGCVFRPSVVAILLLCYSIELIKKTT